MFIRNLVARPVYTDAPRLRESIAGTDPVHNVRTVAFETYASRARVRGVLGFPGEEPGSRTDRESLAKRMPADRGRFEASRGLRMNSVRCLQERVDVDDVRAIGGRDIT